MRWIVGDVHGCVRELDDLLRAVRFDPIVDQLWSAGDLVNTGPESLETLRLFRDVGGKTVLGNHDIYALRARAGLVPRKKDRLEELYRAADAEPLLAGLLASPAIVFFPRGGKERDVALLHAAVHPLWRGLDEIAALIDSKADEDRLSCDEMAFLTRVRCCDAEGNQFRFAGKPEDAPPPYDAWDAFYRGDWFVVHGHWAMRGFYRNARTMGLDSACVYGERLTAWCLEEDRLESVPCREAIGYRV